MNLYDTSLVQVNASRISITNSYKQNTMQKLVSKYQKKLFEQKHKEQYVKNFAAVKNPFIISKASKRKIFDSINTMYCLSPARTIKMKNGKRLYNFQLSFITLTLPSEQKHTDLEIKNKCLNQLLVELSKHYDVKNYVWKAELQKNKNIHFHLVLDQYIDYQALRRRWNRIVNKLGYVDEYSNKMSKLSLSDYHALRSRSTNVNFQDSAKAYAKGKVSNWNNPNSVDVRKVKSKRDLAIYLSKYIAKSINSYNPNEQDQEREINFGRSWSRSYSLAQMKFINKYIYSEVKEVIKYLDNQKVLVKKCIGAFFTVYFFNAKQLCKNFQDFHNFFMRANAKLYNYPIPKLI